MQLRIYIFEYGTDGSTWITEQKKAGCDQGLGQGLLTLLTWLIHSTSQFRPTPINTLQKMDVAWRILGIIPQSQQMGHKVKLHLTSQSSIPFQFHLIICYPDITLRILCLDTWHSSGYVTYRPWKTLHQVLCKTDARSFCHLHQG